MARRNKPLQYGIITRPPFSLNPPRWHTIKQETTSQTTETTSQKGSDIVEVAPTPDCSEPENGSQVKDTILPEKGDIDTTPSSQNELLTFQDGKVSGGSSNQSTSPSQSASQNEVRPLERAPGISASLDVSTTITYYQPQDPMSEYFRRQLPRLREPLTPDVKAPEDSKTSSAPSHVKDSKTLEPAALLRPQDHPWYFTGYPARVVNGSHPTFSRRDTSSLTTTLQSFIPPSNGVLDTGATGSTTKADLPSGFSMRPALAAVRQQKPQTLEKLFHLQMSLAEDARDPQLVIMLEAMKDAVVEYVEEIKTMKERDERQEEKARARKARQTEARRLKRRSKRSEAAITKSKSATVDANNTGQPTRGPPLPASPRAPLHHATSKKHALPQKPSPPSHHLPKSKVPTTPTPIPDRHTLPNKPLTPSRRLSI